MCNTSGLATCTSGDVTAAHIIQQMMHMAETAATRAQKITRILTGKT